MQWLAGNKVIVVSALDYQNLKLRMAASIARLLQPELVLDFFYKLPRTTPPVAGKSIIHIISVPAAISTVTFLVLLSVTLRTFFTSSLSEDAEKQQSC